MKRPKQPLSIRSKYTYLLAGTMSLTLQIVTGCSYVGIQQTFGTGTEGVQLEAQEGAGFRKTSDPITTEAMGSWQIRGTANALITTGRTLFVGGNFTEIHNSDGRSLPRSYLAAIDRYTGEPDDFAPKLDDEVWALALSPDENSLFVGGSFLTADGLERNRIAAYDVRTGALTSFVTPPLDRALRAVAVVGEKVYLGGMFTKIGTEDWNYIAAFDSTTGELDREFSVAPNARVKALAAEADRLWIGGDFSRVGGARQKGIGALDLVDGSLQPTDDVDYPVIALAISEEQIFIAGGGLGGKAAALDLATGRKRWEISSDGNFQAVDVDDGRFVYFGGHYESIEEDGRADRLTRHDKRSGLVDISWLPRINGYRSINAIDVTPDGLYIGGDFTKVDAEPHEGFAILPGTTD